MNKEFIHYEQALELKELGFDEKCYATIDQVQCLHIKGTKRSPRGSMVYNEVDCPTKRQIFDWVSKNDIYPSIIRLRSWSFVFKIIEWDSNCDSTKVIDSISYHTYEEAELACLKKLIEIAKNK